MSDKTTPKMSQKDNKATILAAYHDLQKKYEEQASCTVNPSKTVIQNQKTQLVSTVDSLSEDTLNGLENTVSTALTNLVENSKNALQDYNNVVEAISVKQAELTELFGIEKAGFALAALLDAQREQKEKFKADQEADRKAQEEFMNERLAAYNADLDRVRNEITQEREEAATIQQRQLQEHEYTFKRQKQMQVDALTDELKKQQRQFDEVMTDREKELHNRESELNTRIHDFAQAEQEVASLKDQVNGIDERVKQEVKAKVAKEKVFIERHFNNQAALKESEHSGVVSLLTSEKTAMEQKVIELQNQVTSLSSKLDGAYKELRDLASDTVKGAGESAILGELKASLASSNNTKK